MHKQTIVLLAVLAIFLSFGFSQSVIGPNLAQVLENDRNGEYRVIVELEEQFGIDSLVDSYAIRGDKKEQRVQLTELLQSKSELSQHWLRNFLGNTRANEIHYFWLVNAISLKADANLIEELAKQSGIKGIYLDQDQIMVQPIQSHARTNAWGVTYIRADLAKVKGEGVVVAVVDTGVDLDHSGFSAGQILVDKAKSFVSGETTADDGNGHGTHCAGTIGSAEYGVAPSVQIVPVKVLSKYGSGSWTGVMNGVQYAYETAQVDVISMSLGGSASTSGNVVEDMVKKAVASGVVCVIAAGNSGHSATPPKSIGTPGVVKEVITVGAIDDGGQLAYFSSRGPTVYGDEKPEIVAPGVDVPSLWKDGGTNTISGTSMATPHVAGLVALLLSKNKNLTPEEVKTALMNTAKGTAKPNTYGKGCVDAVDALNAVQIARTEQRLEKVIQVTTDANGAVSQNQTIESPWEVTMANVKAVWSGGKSSFDSVVMKLDGNVLFSKAVQNGQLYTLGQKVGGGTHQVNVSASGGPANTTVTVTINIDVW